MEQGEMNYKQYLALQSRVDWLYEFHPEFFDQLPPEQRGMLQKGLLYDTDDSDYPESIEDFYKTTIEGDVKLQKDMFHAAQTLYRLSGSGDLELDEA
ncbi:MAG TPA: hypothetical protein VN081_06725 [Dongiaceae bacterium]|nr:hypothetical protein [Dongiaceae bacterium]